MPEALTRERQVEAFGLQPSRRRAEPRINGVDVEGEVDAFRTSSPGNFQRDFCNFIDTESFTVDTPTTIMSSGDAF